MRPTREPARHNQQTYMVSSQTWGRRALFRAERWACLFINTLYHHRGSAYELHAFVLMPDHFHILITPTGALERAVQFIKGGFSHGAKAELGSNMEVWQKGFSDHRIRDAADFDRHVEYIHSNPVRAALCARAEEYEYSSANAAFVVDQVPQRLKPLAAAAACGAAEAAPLQRSTGSKSESAEAPPPNLESKAAALQRSTESKSESAEAPPPKLESAEAAPLQRSTESKSESAEAAPVKEKS